MSAALVGVGQLACNVTASLEDFPYADASILLSGADEVFDGFVCYAVAEMRAPCEHARSSATAGVSSGYRGVGGEGRPGNPSRALAHRLLSALASCLGPRFAEVPSDHLCRLFVGDADGCKDPFWVSVSYSKGYAAAALGTHRVGIDVQAVRRLRSEVVRGLCTQAEYGWHRRGDARRQVQLFSLKESFAKARHVEGLVWPGAYPVYDAGFGLRSTPDGQPAVSSPLDICDRNAVASLTVLA